MIEPLRVLIVDDSVHFLQAARDVLERDGMLVVDASTGAEAVRLAGELRPDVVLVDIDLGEESGFDVVRQLEDPPSTEPPAVILISTHSEQDLAELIDASPAIGFLPKSELSGRAIRELVTRTGGTGHSDGV